MSTDSVQRRLPAEQWDSGDEIDLTRYLNVLRRRWLEILLVTLTVVGFTAAGVVIFRLFTPPLYEANATAAIVRTQTTVQFDSRFTTASESMDTNSTAVDSRRAALVALAGSDAIAEQVILQLGDQLPSDLRNPARLRERVTTAMAGTNNRASDLINIQARAESPELAAAIANAWAEAYVRQVNSVYGQVPDDMLNSVEAQLTEARVAYEQAQADLENYVSTSRMNALTRRINTTTSTLDALEKTKVDTFDSYVSNLVTSTNNIMQSYIAAQADAQTLAFTKEQEGERNRVISYFDAYNAAPVDIFRQQNDRLRTELTSYNDQWVRTNNLLVAARTLQEQVASGDAEAAGSWLAIQMLNLQVINAAGQAPPLQLQLDGSDATGDQATAADLRSQLDALTTSLENQLDTLEQRIGETRQAMLGGASFEELNTPVALDSPLAQTIFTAYPALFQTGVFSTTELQDGANALLSAGKEQAAAFLALAENTDLPSAETPGTPFYNTISQLEEQLRVLQGQLEVERARNQQFAQQRDLAWESVVALSNKQAELQLARAAANSEVRFSGRAVPLDEPVQRASLLLSLALAATVGLLMGVVFALLREIMHAPPLHWRRAASAAA